MSKSKRAFDPARIEERYSDAREDLPFFLEGAKSSPKNLSLLISTALDVACCAVALDVDHQTVRDALRLAGQATAALYLTASSEQFPVEVPIGNGPDCSFSARPDESSVHASGWLHGFFLNAICRDKVLIDRMCNVPTDLLRTSSSKSPEYRYLFVDALKAFWTGNSNCSSLILAALEATDPERSDIKAPDWTLDLDVPQLQHLFYIAQKDSDFAANLPTAISLHNKYWTSSKKRRDNWDGFLAVELTGLAVIAHDRGMQFQIDAASIPNWLVARPDT